MRIWTPVCREKRYFLTLFYREVGAPQFLRIGRETISFGKGREHAGKLTRTQIEITDCAGSVELFPGAQILGLVLHDEPGIDPKYQATLNPEVDEVIFTSPHEIVIVPGDLAKDIAGDNQRFKNQLEVLNGKRRRFVGE